MASKSEILLARQAVQQGRLSVEQANATLQEFDRRRKAGEELDLARFLEEASAGTRSNARGETFAETRIESDEPRTLVEHTPAPGARSRAPSGVQTVTQVAEAGKDPLLGRTLGTNVRILSRLGEGGMGAVYLGRHEGLDKEVVIKILPQALTRDAVLVERFQREARSCARLDHPNVVHVYDVGATPDGVHWITMEFVRGRNLEEILEARKGSLPVEDAIRYVIEISKGLEAAHAKGIVHRDVKPANVLVSTEGAVKVTDFGLALDRTADSNLSQPGEMMGTPYFMSPEQCEGRRVDERSDVYSLGAVLYNLVTGRRLFVGPSAATILVKHIREAPEPASRLRPDLPPGLEAVLQKMLAKDPAARYRTAAEARIDLEETLGGRAVATEASRFADRRLWAAAGVAILLLAVGLGFALGGGGGGRRDRPEPDGNGGPAADPAGEEWAKIRAWAKENPDDLKGQKKRLVEFLGRNPDSSQYGAAREALRALAPGIDEENDRQAAAMMDELLAWLKKDAPGSERGALVKKIEAILEPMQESGESDLAIAMIDAVRAAIEDGRIEFRRGPLGGGRILEMVKDSLQGMRGRAAYDQAASLETEGRLADAHRAYQDAANNHPDKSIREVARAQQVAIARRLAAAGVVWDGDDKDVFSVGVDVEGLTTTPPELGFLFGVSPADWQVVLAGKDGAVHVYRGRGNLVLDEATPALGSSSGLVRLGFEPEGAADGEVLATFGLDTDGEAAIRIDVFHRAAAEPRLEALVRVVPKEKGFTRPLDGLVGAPAPDRRAEARAVSLAASPNPGCARDVLFQWKAAAGTVEVRVGDAGEPPHVLTLGEGGLAASAQLRFFLSSARHPAHLHELRMTGKLRRGPR